MVLALPQQTTILREPAAELTQKAATYFRNKAQASDDPVAFIYSAGLLNNLANRLSALGRREEALNAAEEAVGHYRALAAARPDAFIPDLALSLNTLANRLSDLGHREAALQRRRGGRTLPRAGRFAPRRVSPDLARSLNNFAISSERLGRSEEALTAAQEAVGLRRALAASRPDAFLPDLASR